MECGREKDIPIHNLIWIVSFCSFLMESLFCNMQLIESRISTFQSALQLSCALDLLYTGVSICMCCYIHDEISKMSSFTYTSSLTRLLTRKMKVTRLCLLFTRTRMKVRKRSPKMPWKLTKKAKMRMGTRLVVLVMLERVMAWVISSSCEVFCWGCIR